MDELRTDRGRAAYGAGIGAAIAIGIVAVMVDVVPTWFAVPGAIALVGGWAIAGGMVALAVGDWWDRR